MKAFSFDRYGATDQIRLTEQPKPEIGDGGILVRVRAVSVNPVDYKIAHGAGLHIPFVVRWPRISGTDFAGVVEAVGKDQTRFRPGDRVFGVTGAYIGGVGCHAEYYSAVEKVLWPLPDDVSFADAASLPCAALTAWNGLSGCGELKGRKMLLTGATGGVGHFAMQLATLRGAEVSAVCSASNAALASQLGARRALDYRDLDYASLRGQYDLFFDAYGATDLETAFAVLAGRGHYVTTLPRGMKIARALLPFLFGSPTVRMANLNPDRAAMAQIVEWMRGGRLRPVIAASLPFDQIDKAYAMLEKGGVAGKIVVTLD